MSGSVSPSVLKRRMRDEASRPSAFRKAVWDILCDIPYGHSTTYGEIARKTAARTGKRTSARAVGGAIGHNPISIIIPCHRVVGVDGSLTGYAGGVSAKCALLALEGVDTAAFARRPSCGP